MTSTTDHAIATARELLAKVTHDSDGIMIGHLRQGGNGGLQSPETLRAADQLRRALDALDQDSTTTDTSGEAASIVAEIAAERQRQIGREGWDVAHDDAHDKGQLAQAAGCYALFGQTNEPRRPPFNWPFQWGWWKPRGPRRDYVRAAALLVAEIERLDRLDARRAERATSEACHD